MWTCGRKQYGRAGQHPPDSPFLAPRHPVRTTTLLATEGMQRATDRVEQERACHSGIARTEFVT